jgi:hypothetical protein
MPADALSFALDHAQYRVHLDRLATLISGQFEPDAELKNPVRGWSDRWGTTDANGDLLTYVEPVKGALMLAPAPFLKAWQTTGTGIYARLGLSDVTLGDATKWKEHVMDGSASKFLKLTDSNAGSGARTILTNTTWPKNRPFYLGWFVADWGGEKRYRLECGWNNSASSASGVSLRFFADGSVEVWKNAVLVGKGSLGDVQKANKVLAIALIPYRRRELLIVTPEGKGFSHTFDDIDENETDPTITGATKFWAYVPEGMADLELAPIRFPASAYRAGITSIFSEAPGSGETVETTLYRDNPGYGAVTSSAKLVTAADAAVDFLPDGVTRSARVRVDLTSDGEATPFAYGVQAEFPTQRQLTDDSEVKNLDEFTLSYSISFAEDASTTSVELVLNRPDELDPLGSIPLQVNRPLEVTYGGRAFLDCFTEPVQFVEAHGDSNRRVTLRARDRWKSLENYRFQDPTPLDGLTLRQAVLKICKAAGIEEAETDIEDDAFTLPSSGRGSSGDWSVLIEAGDTAADWLNRLKESYAGNWFLGIAPSPTGPVLRFRSPETMDEEPLLTLYLTEAEALADGVPADQVRNVVLRSFVETSLEPEANDIYVLGMDPRTRRPIAVHYPDTASQDPTTAPSARPDNWLGEIRRYGYLDPYLPTLAAVERCAELLYKRLTPRRYVAEVECEALLDPATLLPAWKGQVVTIFGKGDYRIQTGGFDAPREPTAEIDFVWREGRYVLEKLVDGTAKGCGQRGTSTTVAAMKELQQFRLYQIAQVVQPGAEGLEKRPPIVSSVLP